MASRRTENEEKAKRYAQTAPRDRMPRPAVFGSKKTYDRKQDKRFVREEADLERE